MHIYMHIIHNAYGVRHAEAAARGQAAARGSGWQVRVSKASAREGMHTRTSAAGTRKELELAFDRTEPPNSLGGCEGCIFPSRSHGTPVRFTSHECRFEQTARGALTSRFAGRAR